MKKLLLIFHVRHDVGRGVVHVFPQFLELDEESHGEEGRPPLLVVSFGIGAVEQGPILI